MAGTQLQPRRSSEQWLRDNIAYADILLKSVGESARKKNLIALRRASSNALLEMAAGDIEEAVQSAMCAQNHAWLEQLFNWPSAMIGRTKSIRGASKGQRNKANESRQAHDQWQKEADKLWAKHPTHSKNVIAQLIDKSRANTIRQIIKKKKS